MNIFMRLAELLWGKMEKKEVTRFILLGTIAFFIITTYSMIRPLKDVLFMRTVGTSFIPEAKIVSFLIMIPLVLGYGKLVDLVRKHQLFYILGGGYAVLFFTIAFMLSIPHVGLENTVTSPYRIVGWLIYVGIESFIVLMLALFWSFVASNSNNESAKHTYPLIIGIAQLGSILGPEFAKNVKYIGMVNLVILVGCCMLIIMAIVRLLVHVNPEIAQDTKERKPTGPIAGLKLLLARPYLLALIATTAFFTMIVSMLDYIILLQADKQFHSIEKLSHFVGLLTQTSNMVALLFAFTGSSFFIRKFGTTTCLVAFPVIIGIGFIYVWFDPSLWVLFGAMVSIKGLSYALNQPCREMLYIPTSRDIKFKAKSWIDGFGYRGTYALGSGINKLFTGVAAQLMYVPLITIVMSGLWALVALYLGKTNQKLIAENKIIE
jgi:ATP:ADP antiporter, AAA family